MIDLAIPDPLPQLSFCVLLMKVVLLRAEAREFGKLVYRGKVGDVHPSCLLALAQVDQSPSCGVILMLVWVEVVVKARYFGLGR